MLLRAQCLLKGECRCLQSDFADEQCPYIEADISQAELAINPIIKKNLNAMSCVVLLIFFFCIASMSNRDDKNNSTKLKKGTSIEGQRSTRLVWKQACVLTYSGFSHWTFSLNHNRVDVNVNTQTRTIFLHTLIF